MKGTYHGQTVAVKTLKTGARTSSNHMQRKAFRGLFVPDDEAIEAFINEIKLMSRLRHPNIIYFYGGIWTQGADKMCLVLEFAGRGSLSAWIGNDEIAWGKRGRRIAADAALGVAYLHARSPPVIHRDIKPENFMLMASFVAKLCDFGESTSMAGDFMSTVVGTPVYVAPEVTRMDGYTEAADVFGFGLVLFELITGKTTIELARDRGLSRKHVARFHAKGERLSWSPMVSTRSRTQISDLAKRCLDDDPKKRPRMDEVTNALVGQEGESESSFSIRTSRKGCHLRTGAESQRPASEDEVKALNAELMKARQTITTLRNRLSLATGAEEEVELGEPNSDQREGEPKNDQQEGEPKNDQQEGEPKNDEQEGEPKNEQKKER